VAVAVTHILRRTDGACTNEVLSYFESLADHFPLLGTVGIASADKPTPAGSTAARVCMVFSFGQDFALEECYLDSRC
jgi:hypothetical protein